MIDFEKYAKLGESYNYVQDAFIELKELLESFKSTEGRSVRVFLQGSYKNDTNIGKESDIDIVVYYDEVFSSNIRYPEDEELLEVTTNISNSDVQRYDNTFSVASYTSEKFKYEVMEYLQKVF